MQNDVDDPLLPLAKAAQQLTRTMGVSVHVSTLHRWRSPGVRGRRLQCQRIGGRWYTSLAMLQDFFHDAGGPEVRPLGTARRASRAQQQLADEFGT